MPKFRVRLDDPAAGEFRVMVVHAADEQAAVERALRWEQKTVRFRLPDDEAADLEARDAAGMLTRPGRDWGLLTAHRQAEPYQVTSVTRIGG